MNIGNGFFSGISRNWFAYVSRTFNRKKIRFVNDVLIFTDVTSAKKTSAWWRSCIPLTTPLMVFWLFDFHWSSRMKYILKSILTNTQFNYDELFMINDNNGFFLMTHDTSRFRQLITLVHLVQTFTYGFNLCSNGMWMLQEIKFENKKYWQNSTYIRLILIIL